MTGRSWTITLARGGALLHTTDLTDRAFTAEITRSLGSAVLAGASDAGLPPLTRAHVTAEYRPPPPRTPSRPGRTHRHAHVPTLFATAVSEACGALAFPLLRETALVAPTMRTPLLPRSGVRGRRAVRCWRGFGLRCRAVASLPALPLRARTALMPWLVVEAAGPPNLDHLRFRGRLSALGRRGGGRNFLARSRIRRGDFSG